jgi:SAM-dependent methyltransferase
MSQEETVMALPQGTGKVWRSYLPFPLELERCACPICSSGKAETLMTFDQFGFPIGTVECEECGFVYTNPRPTPAYMKVFYEKYFWFFFQGRVKISERFFRRQRTREWAALKYSRCAPYLSKAKGVLEIGAGSGLFLDHVRKNLPGTSVAGIEPDPKMAEYCRNELKLDVQTGFFQDYQGKKVFDAIVLFHVVEHLFEFTSLFQFIRKHLAPGGVVIMEAPDVDGPWKTVYMIQLSHMHLFSPRTIKNLFLTKGFEVLQVSCLQGELDISNLFIAGRLGETPQEAPVPRDPEESMRIRARFQQMPASRMFLVLRAWVRLAYFALRR